MKVLVAVKRVAPEVASDPLHAERLQREAGTMARRALTGEFSALQVERPEWDDVRQIADELRSAREIVRNRIINDRRRKGDL